MVSGPQNQPEWLTISSHRSRCKRRETAVAARWQHSPMYSSQNTADLGGVIPRNILGHPNLMQFEAGCKTCAPLEWCPCTLKPENLAHFLHSTGSAVVCKLPCRDSMVGPTHLGTKMSKIGVHLWQCPRSLKPSIQRCMRAVR